MNGTGLFGSATLEVAIGLFFVYLLLSLICSSINELLASFLKWRAKNLQDGIQNLICDSRLFNDVMAHPLIKALGNTRTETEVVQQGAGQGLAGKPSYIPSRVFALALLDVVGPAQDGQRTVAEIQNRARELVAKGDARQKQIGGAVTALIAQSRDPQRVSQRVEDIKQMIAQLPAPANAAEAQQLKELAAIISPARSLQEIEQAVVAVLPPESTAGQHVLRTVGSIRAHLADIECDLSVLQQNVAQWYDDAMGRVSGVYKRKTQAVLLVIAVLVSGVLGADSLRIVTNLSVNPALRAALAEEANRQTSTGGALSPVLSPTAVPVPGAPPASPVPASDSAPIAPTDGTAPIAPTDGTASSISALVGTLTPFSALFGYDDMPAVRDAHWGPWLLWKVVGILLTVCAISLGAPFWFDVLNKVANVRGTGKRPDTVEEQKGSLVTVAETRSQ